MLIDNQFNYFAVSGLFNKRKNLFEVKYPAKYAYFIYVIYSFDRFNVRYMSLDVKIFGK